MVCTIPCLLFDSWTKAIVSACDICVGWCHSLDITFGLGDRRQLSLQRGSWIIQHFSGPTYSDSGLVVEDSLSSDHAHAPAKEHGHCLDHGTPTLSLSFSATETAKIFCKWSCSLCLDININKERSRRNRMSYLSVGRPRIKYRWPFSNQLRRALWRGVLYTHARANVLFLSRSCPMEKVETCKNKWIPAALDGRHFNLISRLSFGRWSSFFVNRFIGSFDGTVRLFSSPRFSLGS